MATKSPKATLRALIRDYGIDQVRQHLDELVLEGAVLGGRSPRVSTSRGSASKSRPRPNAIEYVAKMNLPDEKGTSMTELAARFEAKSFLPSLYDIATFCSLHGVPEPASRSRASAMPRVFQRIAMMDAKAIQRMVDHHAFPAPSRVGPIADAIRNYRRPTAPASSGRGTTR